MPSVICATLVCMRVRHPSGSFPLLDVMPQSLDNVRPDFRWSRERLWALELPVGRVSVEDLRFHLDLPIWSFDDVPFSVSPAEVRADPSRYHLQYARTMAADACTHISRCIDLL
jgi:hypothetical protein